jgi:hypothetical protein
MRTGWKILFSNMWQEQTIMTEMKSLGKVMNPESQCKLKCQHISGMKAIYIYYFLCNIFLISKFKGILKNLWGFKDSLKSISWEGPEPRKPVQGIYYISMQQFL